MGYLRYIYIQVQRVKIFKMKGQERGGRGRRRREKKKKGREFWFTKYSDSFLGSYGCLPFHYFEGSGIFTMKELAADYQDQKLESSSLVEPTCRFQELERYYKKAMEILDFEKDGYVRNTRILQKFFPRVLYDLILEYSAPKIRVVSRFR